MDETQPTLAARRVRAVLDGEPEAFDRWFRAEHPAVWRLALGFLADAAEAEDLAQDAMLKLHDRLADWDARRPWSGFRNTLVLNLCRDRLRRIEARRRAEGGAAEERLPATIGDPAELAARGELRGVIEAALGRLPEREREAFVLRELEGLETREVAAMLSIGESSVRSLLTLARRRLRELLGERLVGFVAGGGAMAEAREPLDVLQEAWDALEAPAPDAELDAPDARTEAAVDWMRAAWESLEAPAPRLAAPRARHLFAGGSRRLGWLAAAAVVVIASVPLVRGALEPRTPVPVPASPAGGPARHAALERPDGAIELREGPVRLVLLMPDPSPADRGGQFNR